jgi:predicted S18 family serine protease
MNYRQILFVFSLVAVIASIYLAYPSTQAVSVPQTTTRNIILTYSPIQQVQQQITLGQHSARLYLPAIDSEGNGVMASVVVTAVPGTGKLTLEVYPSNPRLTAQTQQSIVTAVAAARALSGIQGEYDLTFSLQATTGQIDGPSAGAAFALAAYSALTATPLRSDAVITGAILPSGQIGQVGAIPQKSEAVSKAGFKLFVVPSGQGNLVPATTGLQVVEASSLSKALSYFTNS